jgi:hypothetical protein
MRIFFFLFALTLFSHERTSSYPYLSGDTWLFFADWRLTKLEDFDPSKVKLGDTILVEHARLKRFFHKYLRKIKYQFILITPNNETDGDQPLPGPYAKALKDPKIAAWFLQNLDCKPKDKIIPIPIGIANTVWDHGQTSILTSQIENAPPAGDETRKQFLYCNFSVGTNKEARTPCLEAFQNRGSVRFETSRTFSDYLLDLSETVFVPSPPGHGLDCHRTWEALLMGCYPIVMSSTLDPLYVDLPIVIIRDWSEATEELLNQKLQEFKSRSWKFEKLYAPYWFEKVREIQKRLRRT